MDSSELPLRQAALLGALHGPTELLPISSSAHTALLPWLARWPYLELPASRRKSFEVALHAGTAVALLLRAPSKRSAKPDFLVSAVAPAALTGYLLGERIEQRLGTPGTIAGGLLAGAAALAGSELRAGGAGEGEWRRVDEANWRDGLALGLAQALALIPGVSRSGASIAAARWRGFSRHDSDRLSWTAGLPVIAGATALKSAHLIGESAHEENSSARGWRSRLLAGAISSFASTWLACGWLPARRRAALLPACLAWRSALAMLVIRRMRDNTSIHQP